MTISNVSISAVHKALQHVNSIYSNNIEFKSYKELSEKRVSCTLKAASSHVYGARVSSSGRRLTAASWQVHRDFMTVIFNDCPNANIYTAFAKYKGIQDFEDKFPDTYYTNCGSYFSPCYIGDTEINENGEKPF